MFKKLRAAYLRLTRHLNTHRPDPLPYGYAIYRQGSSTSWQPRHNIRYQIHLPFESMLLDIRPPTRREFPLISL